ncbi:MAG: 16S rRNA (guanine(527)-N(7))-methyltransferase RsmG [Treponema sp.]|jgi:16S rRNA (guanine527-N7)-methyltransferase|nr:16S rRNA (guanine(527)-N(7))-methyltransferase RsmG [Treponema sp.]
MIRNVKEGILHLQKDPAINRVLPEDRTAELAALLERYIGEIELFNPAYGLVGAKDRAELITKHILDSLAPLGIIAGLLERYAAPQIADVGSGAGLPGIPLAIALPRFHFTLIERMGRRAGFLRNTIAVLGLNQVTVEETEMEKAGPGRFDLATFRAFRPLEPPILRNLFRLLSPGGTLAAYKGRREAIEKEMAGVDAGPWESIPCPVPGLAEERHLLVIHLPKKQ